VQIAGRDESTLAHLALTLPRMHEPLGGVLGTHVPVVADDEDFVVRAPGWAAGLTVLLYGFLLVLAGRAASRGHAAVLYLLAAGLALLVTFVSASQDIVLDAYRREILPDAELGLGSSIFVNGSIASSNSRRSSADQVPARASRS